MAFLVLKDTGAFKINADNTTGVVSYTATDVVDNPIIGYVNLKPFSMSIKSGVRVDNTEDLSNFIPQVTTGSKLPLNIEFNVNYDVRPSDRTSVNGLSPVDLVNAEIYLTRYSKKGTILLLYWMTDNSNEIINGQAMDYYSSQLRVQVETEWAINTNIYPNLSAGTSGSLLGTYAPRVLPIVINSVTALETAGNKLIQISVSANIIGKGL